MGVNNRYKGTCSSNAALVNKYVGTAYDHVKTVSDNIEDVKTIADALGEEFPESGLDTLVENIDDVVTVGSNIDDVITVSSIKDEVITVAGIEQEIVDVPSYTAQAIDAANAAEEDADRAEQAADDFEATFAAQFKYKHVGNISDHVGETLTDADKLNAYRFPDDTGEWYGPLQSQTFPITVPANPETDDEWVNVNRTTADLVTTTEGDSVQSVLDSYGIKSVDKGEYTSGIELATKYDYVSYSGKSYFATNPPYTTTATTPDADGNLFVGGYLNQSANLSASPVTAAGSTTPRTLGDRFADVVNVKDFGAKGDGVTDDTQAIQDALFSDASEIFLSKGTYTVSAPIQLPTGKRLYGAGRNNTILRRASDDTNNHTITDSGTGKVFTDNILLFVEAGGQGSRIEHLRLQGCEDETQGTILMHFSETTFFVTVTDVRAANARKCIYTDSELWMSSFTSVHCASAWEAWALDNAGFKTSLDFANCWCENTGTGYRLRNLHYGSFTACGADHVARPLVNPYDPADTNPYGKEFGNPFDSHGVYDFSNCYGVSINGCGTELSWQGSVLRNHASYLSVNGLRSYALKSAYTPNYSSYPAWGHGDITTTTERCGMTLTGLMIQHTEFFNKTADQRYTVGFNYLEAAYGEENVTMVSLDSGYVEMHYGKNTGDTNKAIAIGGNGSGLKYGIDNLSRRTFNYLSATLIDGTRSISKKFSGTGNTVKIPIIPQGSSNRAFVAKVTVVNGGNATGQASGSIEFTGRLLTTAVFIDSASSPVGGLNTPTGQGTTDIVITTPNNITNPIVTIEVTGVGGRNLDIDGITFG